MTVYRTCFSASLCRPTYDVLKNETYTCLAYFLHSAPLVYFRFAYHDLTSVSRVDLKFGRPDSVRVSYVLLSSDNLSKCLL